MNRFVFVWHMTDGYTYGFDTVTPFECNDLDDFILQSVEQVKASEWGCEVLGIYIEKSEADNLYECFYTLEQWFKENNYRI